jgi:hypothetical protein
LQELSILVQVAVFLVCILEVPSSALGWDIDYPEYFWFFVDLLREILSNTLT